MKTLIIAIFCIFSVSVYAQSGAQADEEIQNIISDEYDISLGDANADGNIKVGDAVYIINYIYRNGPPPVTLSQLYWNKWCQLEAKMDSLSVKMDSLMMLEIYIQDVVTTHFLSAKAFPWWIELYPQDSLGDTL